jgi:hypothetical protein
MPSHAAPKNPDRTTDRIAGFVTATFVAIAIAGIATDALARPKAGDSRPEPHWLDDLMGDVLHPDHAVGNLNHRLSPHRAATSAKPPAKPHKPAESPHRPVKHQPPGKPHRGPHRPPSDPDSGHHSGWPTRSGWGREQTGPKLRIPRVLTDTLRRLSEQR